VRQGLRRRDQVGFVLAVVIVEQDDRQSHAHGFARGRDAGVGQGSIGHSETLLALELGCEKRFRA
jgi:hypothetical protein